MGLFSSIGKIFGGVVGGLLGGLFGGSRKSRPPQIIEQKPIEKIFQSEEEREKQNLIRRLARRRKASVLNQLSEANIKRQILGPRS